MTKMTGESKDIVAERLEQLKALVPEAFAEGKIDFDALKGALGEAVDSSKEHYRFTWNGKEEARAFALRPSMGTLRPCVAESSGKDGTPGQFDSDNLYIEGDNLEVLKLLQGSYHNAVKMIYIDPPYNTGHDFVYADDFSDSIKNYKEQTRLSDDNGMATHSKNLRNADTSGRYHTDWLNMMFPRLLLARNLLRDDGVIFISIDDSESQNLRKLCDEVFGEVNFIAQVVWQKIHSIKNDAHYFSDNHEYALVYAKSKDAFEINLLPRTKDERYKNPDNDPRGPWQSGDLVASGERSTGHYIIKSPITGKEFDVPQDKHWVYAEDNLKSLVNSGQIYFGVDGNAFPRKKRYLSEVQDGRTPSTLWSCDEVGHNQSAARDLKELFDGRKVFDFPKPVEYIQRMIQLASKEDCIVMDFFSGSAATAHSIFQQNVVDNHNRKFIMVQLPETCAADSEAAKEKFKNICEIGKERIRRAGKKIKEENPLFAGDIGFKVFKLDTSNIIPWNPNPEDLKSSLLAAVENAVEGRTVDDILYEILLKCNLPLTLPIEKKTFGENTINVVGEGALMICLDKPIKAAVAEEMVRLRDEVYKPEVAMQVVFLDNGFTDKEKANAIAALVQAGVEEKAIHSI